MADNNEICGDNNISGSGITVDGKQVDCSSLSASAGMLATPHAHQVPDTAHIGKPIEGATVIVNRMHGKTLSGPN